MLCPLNNICISLCDIHCVFCRPLLPNVKPKRQETRMISAIGPPMAEVLRGLHAPPKQNVTKAPLKADSPLKPDATNNPIFNSSTKSGATRNPQHSAFPMATMTSMSTDVNSFFFLS